MRLVLTQPTPPSGGISAAPVEAVEALFPDFPPLQTDDLLVLPEHAFSSSTRAVYLQAMRSLVKRAGCHLIGGSYHEQRDGHLVNTGHAFAPDGTVLCSYEKLRPYARERTVVEPGQALGTFTIAGRNIMMMICADFWFTDLIFDAGVAPDIIVVPAFSVSRKPTPAYSRTLWRHTAIARAYELGVFVGVSDWAHIDGAAFPTSGVSGFADPTTTNADAFFTPVDRVGLFDLDFQALDGFRRDRRERGFFWNTPAPETS